MPVRNSLTTTSNADKRRINAGSTPMPRRRHGSVRRRLMVNLLVVLLFALFFLAAGAEGFRATTRLASRRSDAGSFHRAWLNLAGTSKSVERTLGLLTFDLDDTLFPVNEVVLDANQKMVSHMKQLGFEASVTDYLDAARAIRRQLNKPITYTELRKLAIEAELNRLTSHVGGGNIVETARLVDECYQVWEDERHAAAERYLFPDAVAMLKLVKLAYPDACIAAVTNGKGNPLLMYGSLKEYFEFCVSGEDDDVFPNRKPHAGIYEVTRARYRELYAHHTDQSHIWCHVGDCLANDVGASAACGAFTVWYAPHDVDESSTRRKQDLTLPSYSTASQQDLAQRAKQAHAAQELVAVRIRRLADLSNAIAELVAGTSIGSRQV